MCKEEKKKHKLWKIALLRKQWIKKLKYLINQKAIKKKKKYWKQTKTQEFTLGN